VPRIAVAVGVVTLITFSIGFNTARYTVVWDMVGGSSDPSQPGQPSPSAAVPQPTTVVEDDAAHRTAVAAGKAGTRREDACGLAARQPQQPGPSTRESAGVGAAEASTPSAPVSQLAHDMPRDVRPDAAAYADSGCQVRRLPPVDQVAPCPADRRLMRSPQDPIPIYPGGGT